MGKMILRGDRIAVLARTNVFAEGTPDHALFSALQDGQTGVEFVHAADAAGSDDEAKAALRTLQRWADYGIVAFVPVDQQAAWARQHRERGDADAQAKPAARSGFRIARKAAASKGGRHA